MYELIAIVSAGIFAGASIYVSWAQQAALFEAGGPTAAVYFPPMYRRAAPMQAGLALAGTIAGIAAFATGSGVVWLAGALLLGSVIPFTLLRMKAVNDRLLAPGLDPQDPEIPALLGEWGRLHLYRTVASAVAFALFVAA